jgi:hypothetical protein
MKTLFRLRRYLDAPAKKPSKPPACELCGAPLGGDHKHVVDVEQRRLLCACRPCYLLFTNSGAAGGKFRSVSERILKLSGAAPASGLWEALEIPVGIAFFLRQSARGRVVAFYPSPAGVTESGLPLEAWSEIVASSPQLATLEPDTEALLVCRRPQTVEAWIVPVDACYEIAGRIRRHWKGFDGGEEAWRTIDEFFTCLSQNEGVCA